MAYMIIAFALLTIYILTILTLFLRTVIRNRRRDEFHDFREIYIQKRLFYNSEAELFRTLLTISKTRFIVLTKVRIWDFIDVNIHGDRSKRQVFLNKIIQKHVDFLLVSRYDHSILLAIELDGPSHNNKSAIARDKFKDSLFEAVDIKLLRIRTDTSLDIATINLLIGTHIPQHVHNQLRVETILQNSPPIQNLK